MAWYTIKYLIPVTSEQAFTDEFEASNDKEAVEKGKTLFLDKVKGAHIPDWSKLIAIYRSPINLLEKPIRIEKTIPFPDYSLRVEV